MPKADPPPPPPVTRCSSRWSSRPPTTSSYDYDPTSGPLAELFTTIADIIDLGVPTGTLKVDHLAWGRWCEFCLEMKTSPWRTDQPANTGADPAGFQREAKLLCAFLLWVYNRIQPRSKADPAPKPESAYNIVCAVRRVHRRNNISMVSCTQLSAVLKGLTASFIIEHGAEALLPTRRQPLGPHLLRQLLGGVPATQTGQRLGSQRLDWAAPLFQSLGAMFALAGSTGFRKAEVALPSGCAAAAEEAAAGAAAGETVAATADNVHRSLRSGHPFSAVPHL